MVGITQGEVEVWYVHAHSDDLKQGTEADWYTAGAVLH